MTDQKELTFNYNDLNLDFLELSPPRANAAGAISTVSKSFSILPNAYKAKQLAQRVAQNDVLVNQIELLKTENSKLQQMLKDFQKSATHIQKLYENEKKKCNDFQIQQKAVELKSKELETHFAQLNHDIAEKRMQLEQLQAKLDETKGLLSYTELAMKYLKLMQKLNEEENLNVRDKPMFLKLSKYCEDRGCKVPILKVCKQKRIYKKDKDIQCNLLDSSNPPISQELQTRSTVEFQTQTDFPECRDIQRQTLQIDAKSSASVQSRAVQTTLIELRTQGTQHISTTTTRGTSTSCFIKKHNVGTCFPEPTIVSPLNAMIDEVLQEYTVSPLSPICDLISLPSHNEFNVFPSTTVAHTTVSHQSIGTCTYLCNVQRRIDFVPLVTNIKRSQSSSPSIFTCDSVKHEAYATPTPSPPPPSMLPPASDNRNSSAVGEAGTSNLSNMQPMLNAVTHLPDMQPEVFSTIWQMAGQMFLGLLYPPTENHMRLIQLNRANNALNQQQFHNWITSLYESIQHTQPESASTPLPHTECQPHIKRGERAFDTETNTNRIQPTSNSSRCKDTTTSAGFDDCSRNKMADMQHRNAFGANESTQTDNSMPPSNSDLCEGKYLADWIFKEPLEVPKRSAKQTLSRRGAVENPIYIKKQRVKRMRKKRKKEKQEIAEHKNSVESDAKSVVEFSVSDRNEQDFATAVEFCANLCNFSNDLCKQTECGEATVAQKPNTLEVCLDNSTVEERLESCASNEVNFGLEQNNNTKQIRINKDVEVPEDKLSDSENSKCDALDDIAAIIATDAQQQSCQNQLKQKHNTAHSLFGSDSEEEDELNSINVDDMARSVTSLIVQKSDELLDSKKAEQTNLKKDSYKPAETENNTSTRMTNENESLLRPATCELTKTAVGHEEYKEDGMHVQQILLDLAISDSESDENEAIKQAFSQNSTQPNNNFTTEAFCEVDETDDPLLVIVEDVPECTNPCQSSIESSPSKHQDTAWNSQSPTKDAAQQNDGDSDISALLDNELVDDLLANASTQQLCDSILRESANDLKANDGKRKRKSSTSVVVSCKRSARLRAKLSSDESLATRSKHANNGRSSTPEPSQFAEIHDDISTNYYNACPEKSPSKLPLQSKEQIDKKEFQWITEFRQRTNISKVVDSQSITATQNEALEKGAGSGVCENLSAVITKESYSESTLSCPGINEGISTFGASNTSSVYSCPESCEQMPTHCAPTNQTDYDDSPCSPPPAPCIDNTFDSAQPCCKKIPLELNNSAYPIARRSILQHSINYYSANIYAIVTGKKKPHELAGKTALQLEKFLNTTRDRVDVLASTLASSLHEQFDDCEVVANLIIDQVIKAPRPEIELACEVARVPPKCLGTHLRLTSIVLRHLHHKRPEIAAALLTKIENRLFNYQNSETIALSGALNLTQLYLLVIPLHNNQFNPARLFLAKCLYYYNIQASPMIYEVLCWYPTTLPHRDEPNYDRSDALIIVIQHLLMCTTYNMDSKDLRHRELLSLLRFEYHFEPFQPKSLEVLSLLVTKLKTGNLTNLKYAFAVFCKRQPKLVEILLQQQLLPLADEYYKQVALSSEYDERAAALLECISVVVKPLALDTDVSFYLSIFERFLGTVQRPVVQEAAVLAILRLQRFGVNRCFHALVHFKPNYRLQMLTTNALKTFIHKKPLKYWKGLLMQTLSNER
ncbi:little elongation complex subunit 1 [Anastrepha ludens]|uniref:little elongation complex subunit 1 n=1 Tax=Anastrepha ludens TaxID=28586 RepID=UPI0023B1DAA8|nr:little elongation complex subunit 1 [Anastrepha ludens]XP_053963493.1 little elongation complex subunit 1 [Anastrepha ludens]